tara:strand:+ start:11732 stop:11962 length:231 start_codon:yes stop_codon:yes gene_type:complete
MIDYISANDASIEIYSSNTLLGVATTAKTICDFLQEFGYDGSVATSSSMDFSDEDGFDTADGAKNLWAAGVSLYYT